MQEKQKSVPPVEENTQPKESAEVSEAENSHSLSTASEPKKSALKLPSKSELMRNPLKYIEMAVGAFENMNERVNNIENAVVQMAGHIDARDKTLAPLVELAERVKQAQQAQQQGQTGAPQSQGMRGIPPWAAQLLPALLGGSEKSSTDKYFMQVGMDTVGLGHELYKAFIKEMIPEVITRWEAKKKAMIEGKES